MSEYGYGYGTHPPNLIYIDGRSSNEANFSPNYGFYGMSIPPTNPYPTNYPSIHIIPHQKQRHHHTLNN